MSEASLKSVNGSQVLRVAVVQIDYHPAYRRKLGVSCLEEPLGADEDLQLNPTNVPPEELPGLRERIAASYEKQLLLRVRPILDWCQGHGVQLVVFPEYAIPAAILPALAEAAGQVVVVAGSHLVDRAALRSKVYERLGATNAPPLETAVSPVVYRETLLALVPKVHASPVADERAVLKPGVAWQPVELPDGMPGPMGVALCIDFVDHEAPEVAREVIPHVEAVRFWAVPSLTGTTSDFHSEAAKQARRMKRPVLYANIATSGGSAIFADERELLGPFTAVVPAGQEGLIVADIDLGAKRPGKSTAYAETRAAHVVATPSLVYTSRVSELAYADWLARLATAIGSNDAEALDRATELMKELPDDWGDDVPDTRRRRLEHLIATAENIGSIAEVQALTDEVLLPGDVLPFAELRIAFARGTAAVLRAWRDRQGTDKNHQLAELESKFAARGRRAEDGHWTVLGTESRRAIEEDVRGTAPPFEVTSELQSKLRYYVGEAEEAFQAAYQRTEAAFREEHFQDAKMELVQLLERAKTWMAEDGLSERARRWSAKLQVFLAVTRLNLQELGEAAVLLRQVDADLLEPKARLTLAEMVAELGDVSQARVLLANVPRDDAALAKALAHAEQVIQLSSGSVPEEAIGDSDILVKAAQLMLTVGRLPEAVELARQAVELEPNRILLRTVATIVVLRAVERTIQPDSPGIKLLPVEKREEVIDLADTWLAEFGQKDADLRGGGLPDAVKHSLANARSAYHFVTWDLDALDALKRGDDRLADAEQTSPAIEAALERARQGDVKGALEMLPSTGSAWVDELRRADLMAISGDAHGAIEVDRATATRFPDIGTVRVSLAERLLNAGQSTEALEHATRAAELVPSKGYRFLLARCLIAEGRPSEAWDLLKRYSATGDRRIVRTLAELASELHPHEAVELWSRFVELRPGDSDAKVMLAWAQFAAGQVQRAAEQAWRTVEQHGDELTLGALAACAKLQTGTTSPLERRERASAISGILYRRFPTDPQAHHVRLMLRIESGDEPDSPAVDFELMKSAGWLQAMPVEQLPQWLELRGTWGHQVWALYDMGGISLEGLAHSVGGRVTEVTAGFFAQSRGTARSENTKFVCGPILLNSPPESLAGLELLFGAVELLMVAHVGLVPDLRRQSRAAGATVLVPSDVRSTLLGEVEQLTGRSPAAADAAKAAHDLVLTGEKEGWLRILPDAELRAGYREAIPETPSARDPNMDELVAVPLATALKMAVGTLAKPRRWRVTADHFGTWGVGHPQFVSGLAWRDVDHYLETAKLMRAAAERCFSLPMLVRFLLPMDEPTAERRKRILGTFARVGFADAWSSDDLVTLAETEPSLDGLSNEFEGIEHLARHSDVFVSDPAIAHISGLYGAAIASAFMNKASAKEPVVTALPRQKTENANGQRTDRLRPDQSKLLAAALLGRIKDLDGSHGTLLDLVLSNVAVHAVQHPSASVEPSPDDPNVLRLAEESPAGRMWGYLREWAGPTGRRRAALGRALRDAWCFLDDIAPEEGPTPARCLPLILAGRVGRLGKEQQTKRVPMLELPERETLAILSANWAYRPLVEEEMTTSFAEAGKPPVSASFTWEQILTTGATQLETDWPRHRFDERFMSVEQRVPDTDATLPTLVPAEAAVLRVRPAACGPAVAQLKKLQGHHDGRAYGLLGQLEQRPSDASVRRAYARHSARALWRLVRDDPAYLARWPWQRPITSDCLRPTLETLLELLHEPLEPLGPNAVSSSVLNERVGQSWKDLEGGVRAALFYDVTRLPGGLGTVSVLHRVEGSGANDLDNCLWHLEHAEVVPAAVLAGDVMVLRLAADRKPTVELKRGQVDLREVLPTVFADLLRNLRRADYPHGTMARDEEALLQVCASVCRRLLLFTPGRGLPDWLWLTYRLHSWLSIQLSTLSTDVRPTGIGELAAAAPDVSDFTGPPDLMNPFLFPKREFNYRLAVVLFSLGAMEELAVQASSSDEGASDEGVSTISGPGLEKQLVELASERSKEQPYWGSWLDWNAPDNVPDLALAVLLKMSPERVLEMSDEALTARIERWPNAIEALAEPTRALVESVVTVIGQHASKVSPAVRQSLEVKLYQLEESGLTTKLQWLGLTGLFGIGAAHLEDKVRVLIETHLDERGAAAATERYLRGIGETTERLQSEVLRLHEHWRQSDASREVLTVAIARLILHSDSSLQERAVEVFRAMAAHPYFRHDERLQELVKHLNPA